MKNYFTLLLALLMCNINLSQKTFFGSMLVENFDSLTISTKETILKYDSIFKSNEADSSKISTLGELLYMITRKELQTKISHHGIEFVKKRLIYQKADKEKLVLKSWQNFFQVNIAADFFNTSDFPESIEWFSKALELAREINDSSYLATIHKFFGDIYTSQGDLQAASTSYFLALEIAKAASIDNMTGDIYTSLCLMYNDIDSLDKAVFYEKQALKHNLTTVYIDKTVASCYRLGELFLKKDNKDSAFFYFTKSIEYSESVEVTNEVMRYNIRYMKNNSKLGLLRLSNNLVEQEKVCKEVLAEAEKLELSENIAVALEFLYKVNVKLGNYKEALEYRNREIEVRDKINKEKNIRSVSDLKANLKYESQIELNNEKNESLAKESQLKSNIIYLSLGFLALLALALVFVIINRRKLNQSRKRLEELDKVNKQIFAVIAHDFKEPIINFNILLKQISDKKNLEGEFVDELETQVKSSSDVLNNLLNWARVELEKQEVTKKNINLKELCAKVVSTMEIGINKKNIQIKNLFSPTEIITGDSVMMEIVFRNLLSNAIKFSPVGGKITLRASNGKIEIVDQGKGVATTNTESLFNEKVNPDYGTIGEIGFGLGLFIVKNLLQKNGKTISYSNNNPSGAIFAIKEA